MKRICMGLATMAVVVIGTTAALAQPTPPDVEPGVQKISTITGGGTAVQVGNVQEEVEILRRLLDKSFAAVYGSPAQRLMVLAGAGMGGAGGGMAPPSMGSMGGGSGTVGFGPNMGGREAHHSPNLEGVYLKDYGVVYTVTLPTPPNGMLPGPTVGIVSRTRLSPWERTRKELRGEKIENEGRVASGAPSLSVVILRVLADNGKHFTQLAEGERISVVVTFRDDGVSQPQLPISFWMDSPMGGALSPGSSASAPQPRSPVPSVPGGQPPGGPFVPGTEWVTNIRNALTLGDLHVKQQNFSEALSAYHNAQDQLLKTLEVY